MTELCNTCAYRFFASGFSMCEYAYYNNEPRGCEPKDCKKMGRYSTTKNTSRNPNDVTVLWDFQTSIGRKR